MIQQGSLVFGYPPSSYNIFSLGSEAFLEYGFLVVGSSKPSVLINASSSSAHHLSCIDNLPHPTPSVAVVHG